MTTDAWPGIGLTPVAHEDDLVVQTGRLAYRNPRSTNQPRILSQERCADTVPAGHAKHSLRSVESRTVRGRQRQALAKGDANGPQAPGPDRPASPRPSAGPLSTIGAWRFTVLWCIMR